MQALSRFRARPRTGASLVLLFTAAVAGCGHTPTRPPSPAAAVAAAAPTASPSATHWYWPFHRRAHPLPQPVEELVIQSGPGSAADFPQFWERNTLVLDMRSASGSGSAVLTPREHTLWPVRLVFRVAPGSIGQLEVKGAQRTIFPVATGGSAPVDLQPAPSAYSPRTPAITLVWGPAAAPAAP